MKCFVANSFDLRADLVHTKLQFFFYKCGYLHDLLLSLLYLAECPPRVFESNSSPQRSDHRQAGIGAIWYKSQRLHRITS